TIRCARRPVEDALSLIMSKCVGADTSRSGKLARQKRSFGREIVIHAEKYKPWNRFQGQEEFLLHRQTGVVIESGPARRARFAVRQDCGGRLHVYCGVRDAMSGCPRG